MVGHQVTACGWKGHRVTVYLAIYVTVAGPPDRGVCSHHSANSSNRAEAGSVVKARQIVSYLGTCPKSRCTERARSSSRTVARLPPGPSAQRAAL